MARTSVENKIL